MFQTDGLPPSLGSTSLATIGSTRKTRAALGEHGDGEQRGGRREYGLEARRAVVMNGRTMSANRLDRATEPMLWTERASEPLREPPMFSLEIVTLARLLVDEARERSLRIVTAESCTGGLVAGAICQVSGASDVFERGFVTYSNRAKQELLGVPGDLIADLGAVSEPVARMMAEGALENSNAHISVAITGVAGPGGGTPMKPVGTVHIATARTTTTA